MFSAISSRTLFPAFNLISCLRLHPNPRYMLSVLLRCFFAFVLGFFSYLFCFFSRKSLCFLSSLGLPSRVLLPETLLQLIAGLSCLVHTSIESGFFNFYCSPLTSILLGEHICSLYEDSCLHRGSFEM